MSKPEIIAYDGYLSIDIDARKVSEVEGRAKGQGLAVDVDCSSLEFQYTGRDANRWVVGFLRDLASIVKDADGEITCTLHNDDGDPAFEFYRFRGGTLLRQSGEITRGTVEVVSGAGDSPS
jgi:hypothetical protein